MTIRRRIRGKRRNTALFEYNTSVQARSNETKSFGILDCSHQTLLQLFLGGVLWEQQPTKACERSGESVRVWAISLDHKRQSRESLEWNSVRGSHECQEISLLLSTKSVDDFPEIYNGRVRGVVPVVVEGHLLQLSEVVLILSAEQHLKFLGAAHVNGFVIAHREKAFLKGLKETSDRVIAQVLCVELNVFYKNI